jgi:PTH2 family peptidyl-tRNA hydrolase
MPERVIKQVIVVRKDLNMPVGKIAAQVAHASMRAFLSCRSGQRRDDKYEVWEFLQTGDAVTWNEGISRVAVVGCDTEAELLALQQAAEQAGLPNAIQKDLGLTVFNGVHTNTTLGIGPAEASAVDKITGHLKLLK